MKRSFTIATFFLAAISAVACQEKTPRERFEEAIVICERAMEKNGILPNNPFLDMACESEGYMQKKSAPAVVQPTPTSTPTPTVLEAAYTSMLRDLPYTMYGRPGDRIGFGAVTLMLKSGSEVTTTTITFSILSSETEKGPFDLATSKRRVSAVNHIKHCYLALWPGYDRVTDPVDPTKDGKVRFNLTLKVVPNRVTALQINCFLTDLPPFGKKNVFAFDLDSVETNPHVETSIDRNGNPPKKIRLVLEK